MYNAEKRKQFTTAGELKELLKDIPDETKVLVCCEDYCWFHIEKNGSVINIDNEDLECCYEVGEE